MTPVNVKLDEVRTHRLDAAVRAGFAANRSDALRIALDRQLAAWDELAWARAWDRVEVEGDQDEFADLNRTAVADWSKLDDRD